LAIRQVAWRAYGVKNRVLAMVALRKNGLVVEEFGLREDTLEYLFFNFSCCLGWKVGKS
jgi:carbon starvation protein CstA